MVVVDRSRSARQNGEMGRAQVAQGHAWTDPLFNLVEPGPVLPRLVAEERLLVLEVQPTGLLGRVLVGPLCAAKENHVRSSASRRNRSTVK